MINKGSTVSDGHKLGAKVIYFEYIYKFFVENPNYLG